MKPHKLFRNLSQMIGWILFTSIFFLGCSLKEFRVRTQENPLVSFASDTRRAGRVVIAYVVLTEDGDAAAVRFALKAKLGGTFRTLYDFDGTASGGQFQPIEMDPGRHEILIQLGKPEKRGIFDRRKSTQKEWRSDLTVSPSETYLFVVGHEIAHVKKDFFGDIVGRTVVARVYGPFEVPGLKEVDELKKMAVSQNWALRLYAYATLLKDPHSLEFIKNNVERDPDLRVRYTIRRLRIESSLVRLSTFESKFKNPRMYGDSKEKIYDAAIRSFTDLGLEVFGDHRDRGYVSGGRTPLIGQGAETVNVYVRPKPGGANSVKIKNKRAFAGILLAVDWTPLIFDQIDRNLGR